MSDHYKFPQTPPLPEKQMSNPIKRSDSIEYVQEKNDHNLEKQKMNKSSRDFNFYGDNQPVPHEPIHNSFVDGQRDMQQSSRQSPSRQQKTPAQLFVDRESQNNNNNNYAFNNNNEVKPNPYLGIPNQNNNDMKFSRLGQNLVDSTFEKGASFKNDNRADFSPTAPRSAVSSYTNNKPSSSISKQGEFLLKTPNNNQIPNTATSDVINSLSKNQNNFFSREIPPQNVIETTSNDTSFNNNNSLLPPSQNQQQAGKQNKKKRNYFGNRNAQAASIGGPTSSAGLINFEEEQNFSSSTSNKSGLKK